MDSSFEISLSAMRLDEFEKCFKNEDCKNLNEVLKAGLTRYEKDFFNLLKKVLLDADANIPESNRNTILRFFVTITEFKS